MYCWNCGKEIDEKSVFCPNCGIKQAGVPQPPKEKRPVYLLPVICAAICVGALVGILLLTAGDKEEPEPQIQASVSTSAPAPVTEEPPAAPKTTEPKETKSAVNPKSAELPDLASFLDVKYTQDEWGYTHYVTCLIDREYKDKVVKEVRDLLLEPRYQLEQMDEESDAEGTHYTYEYTGKNENIDWVYLNAGGKYHVKLTVKSGGSGQTALILYCFPEFYLEDPGTESAYAGKLEPEEPEPEPSGGGGGGGGSLFDDKCWYCGGDGRCNNCGGSGHYNQWAGDMYVNVRCTNCNGGSCRQCGGDGKK